VRRTGSTPICLGPIRHRVGQTDASSGMALGLAGYEMPADAVADVLEHESVFGEVVLRDSSIALVVSCFQSARSSHARSNLTTMVRDPGRSPRSRTPLTKARGVQHDRKGLLGFGEPRLD